MPEQGASGSRLDERGAVGKRFVELRAARTELTAVDNLEGEHAAGCLARSDESLET
jgi:hypothetical protein